MQHTAMTCVTWCSSFHPSPWFSGTLHNRKAISLMDLNISSILQPVSFGLMAFSGENWSWLSFNALTHTNTHSVKGQVCAAIARFMSSQWSCTEKFCNNVFLKINPLSLSKKAAYVQLMHSDFMCSKDYWTSQTFIVKLYDGLFHLGFVWVLQLVQHVNFPSWLFILFLFKFFPFLA